MSHMSMYLDFVDLGFLGIFLNFWRPPQVPGEDAETS